MKQTEELLKNGYVTSGGGRGKAYASGTAYANTSSTYKDYFHDDSTGTVKKSGGKSSKKKSTKDYSSDFEEVFDWFEVRLEEINEDLDLMSAKLENAITITGKNNILNDIIKTNKEELKTLEKGYKLYSSYASDLLSEVPSAYREAAKDGKIAIEEFYGKTDEKTLEAIKNYREWAQKAADLKKEMEGVKREIVEAAKQKFDNISDTYDNITELQDNRQQHYIDMADYREDKGWINSGKYYEAAMAEEKKQQESLQNEKKRLQDSLNESVKNGDIKKESPEWYEMVNAIHAVDSELDECNATIEEYQNRINEIHFENFEKGLYRVSRLAEETQNLIDIMADKDIVNDDAEFTSEGMTQMGLYAQQMENYKKQSEMYAEEIDYVNKMYDNGDISFQEYLEKLDELKDGQYEAIQGYKDSKDAIVDLQKARVDAIKEGIEREIEAYEELIDKKKEELSAEKDLYDFQKSITEQKKSVADIERQIAALSGDNSASARAQRKKLEAELAQAQQDLQDNFYDRSVEKQQEALDNELEQFTELREKEMEGWDKWLEKVDAVYADAMGKVEASGTTIKDTIKGVADEWDLQINNKIKTPWENATTAMETTSTLLDEIIAKFQTAAQNADNTASEQIAGQQKENGAIVGAEKQPESPSGGKENEKDKNKDKNTKTYPYGKASATSGNIGYGAKGNAVKAIQWALKELGYSIGKHGVDGSFGPDTLAAVKKFQKKMGIKVDGIVGKNTRAKFKAKGYATGTTGVKKDQWALIDELGEELVIGAENGRLTYLKKGSGVIPADLTSNLMDWGELNPQDVLDRNRPSIGASSSVHATEINLNIQYGDMLRIENFKGDNPEEIAKIVAKQFEKHTKDLNNSLRKYVR